MARRKVLKLTPVLVTLNVLVLLIIASFYITRLVKYYLLENGTKKPNEATIFSPNASSSACITAL